MGEHAATRRHPRVALRVPVDLTTIDRETDPRTGRPCFREHEALCGNLSRGGMFIATLDPPRPGRRLLLRIHAEAGAPPIEALARVAWHTRGAEAGAPAAGFGVEFVRPSPATRAAIERFLRRAPARANSSREG